MADDRNMFARNATAQGGLYATRRWVAPWVVSRPTVQAARNAIAYARVAGTPEFIDTLTGVLPRYIRGQPLSQAIQQRMVSAVSEKFGESAAQGMVARGFQPVIRHAADGAKVVEAPAASGIAKYISGIHRPGFLTAKEGGWLRRAGSGIVDKGRGVQGFAVKAAGSMSTGLTRGVVSGVLKGTVKQLFSKAGLAAGFATAGVFDGGEAIYDLATTDGHVTDLTKNDWKKYGRSLSLTRFGQGLLRGIDGALFGLPSLIPIYHRLAGGDDFLHPSMDAFAKEGSARARYLKDKASYGSNPSPAQLAQVETDYLKRKEDDYVKGVDEFGDDEGISEQEKQKRTAEVAMVRTVRARDRERRAKLLYDFDKAQTPNGPDACSVQAALRWLGQDYARREAQVRESYKDDATYAAAIRLGEAGLGGVKARKAEAALRAGGAEFTAFREGELARGIARVRADATRQAERLYGMQGFGALLENQEAQARTVFENVARAKGYNRDEATQMFNEAWAGMDNYVKGTLDMKDYRNALSADSNQEGDM